MYELQITAAHVLGTCTSDPPVKRGDSFSVRDGDIRIPDGGSICLYALQSMLPLITPKEREVIEDRDEDWMWRVHHVQCPDPKGRVIFKIERTARVYRKARVVGQGENVGSGSEIASVAGGTGRLRHLWVVVEEVQGRCTSQMRPGDHFFLRSGRLYVPAHRHFCLYALHAVLPLLPAKQRPLEDGDWLKEDSHVICPDPAGNVVMRIESI